MWELIFMMLILKIPIVYLALVVYWAIRAEPKPPEPALLPVAPVGPDDRPAWAAGRRPPRRPSRGGPHTSPRGRNRAARATLNG